MNPNESENYFRRKKRSSSRSLLTGQLPTQVPIDFGRQPQTSSYTSPKPSTLRSPWVVVDVKSWTSRVRQRLKDNASDIRLIKILDEMEKQAKSQLICLNGYDQRIDKKANRYLVAFNFFLCLWNFAVSFRFLYLAYLRDDRIRGLLGDVFIGFNGQIILNMLTCIGFFVFACVKFALAYQESVETISFLQLFDKFRLVKFKGSKLDLDPENESSFRRLVLILGQWTSIATIISWIPILSIHLFSMSINPFFTYSLLAYQLAWLPIVHIPVYFSIKATWWFFFHLVVIIYYASSVSKSLETFGHRVKKQPNITNPKELITYFTCQHRLFNIIDKLNREFNYSLFSAYIFGSFMADFIFFCATYLGTGSIYLSTILAALAIAYICAVVSFNLFAASAYRQAESIFARLASHKVAIYVGGIFPVDDFHFSIFFAENASLYLLLITNIAGQYSTSSS